ncbi:putative LOC107380448-like protein, partial [Nothobranchius furzeri]
VSLGEAYNRKPTHPILILILINVITAEERCPTEFEGVVGGNVTFCFKVYWPKIEFLYLQRTLHGTETFVNGFHASKSVTSTWPNTKTTTNKEIIMSGLNVSHEGEYYCYYRYNDTTDQMSFQLQLTITAPFSKPSVTKTCGKKDVDCNITCASHNGYPRQTITWQTSSNVWNHVDNEKQCPTTKMFNISSTFYTNCSGGEVNVSCSVGNNISDTITLCGSQAGPLSNIMIIIIITISAATGILVTVIATKRCWGCKRQKQGAAVKNKGAQEDLMEEIRLTESKETVSTL